VSARPREADPDDEAVQHEILAYLAVNPSGSDTWEGIVEWWLMEREYQREARRVKRALSALVRQGWLQRSLGPDRRTHYRLASERVEEVLKRFGDPMESTD
jgi:DNA-binding transcriptional regulator PaaX